MMRYVTTNLCKAFRCGTSLASLVYESVNRYLGRLPEAEVSETRKDPMDGWIGAIASSTGDESSNHDHYLYGWPKETDHVGRRVRG